MANDSKNDDFPTIRLDEEDRRAYQKKNQPAPGNGSKSTPTGSATSPQPATTKSGGNSIWLALVALIALAGLGGCYYLYTLLQQQQAVAEQAEARIVQLERKLSATGEEIGESTVALQVKVTELSNKTNELWEQMDKLWASAWRRNQKEIEDLGDRVTNVQTGLEKNIQSVSANVKSASTDIANVRNQLANLADEILALNVQLEQAAGDKQQTTQTVNALSGKLADLEKRNSALSGRLTTMENELRNIATKVISSSNSGSPTPPSP